MANENSGRTSYQVGDGHPGGRKIAVGGLQTLRIEITTQIKMVGVVYQFDCRRVSRTLGLSVTSADIGHKAGWLNCALSPILIIEKVEPPGW